MYGLSVLDLVLLAVLLVSAFIGLLRGLVTELLSLAVWATAILGAWWFGPLAGEWLGIGAERFRPLVGGAAVVLAVFVAGAVLRGLLSRTVDAVGLGGLDRTLGLAFGGVRGLLVCLAAVVVMLPFAGHTEWWRASLLQPALQDLARQLLDMMVGPADHASVGLARGLL